MSVRLFYLLFISLLAITTMNACKREPTYPPSPEIEFSRLERYLVHNPFFINPTELFDSIVVTVNFKDGDGDLGMDLAGPPYNPYTIQYNSGNIIKYSGNPPYSCDNYIIGQYDSDGIDDTILIVKDPHYYNYFIELLVKQSNGTYLPYSIIDCGTLNGRFPPLAPDNYHGPIDGSLSFTLNNTNGLKYYLQNETIKFRIYIEDLAFHKSNTVETNDVLLSY